MPSFLFFSHILTTAVPLSVFLTPLAQGATISSVSPVEWNAFNTSIQGRLFATTPFAEPCFQQWKSQNVKLDVEACSNIQRNYTSALIQTNTFGVYGWANFGTCMSTTESCALQYNGNRDKRLPVSKNCALGNLPEYYVDVKDETDVQAALKFAHSKGIPVVVKNSGHDHKGRSSGAGALAIWTNNYKPPLMLKENFVPVGCTESVGDGIVIGTGFDFKRLYQFAEENNRTVVGGAAATVRPAGGWMNGGGHGPLANSLGLGVDNVLEIQLVLPNGTYITANRCQNQDIFFAARGGGGNAFGINMKVTTKAHPRTKTKSFVWQGTAVNKTAFRELFHIIANESNAWASTGWGGTIASGLGSALNVNLRLANINPSAPSANSTFASLISFANRGLTIKTTTWMKPNESTSFYPAYKQIFGGGEGVLGVGVAISSRLIPRQSLETPEQVDRITDTLVQASEMLGANPISWIGHYPFEMLLTTPYNYISPTDASNAVSVTPAWRKAIWHVVIKEGFQTDASLNQTLAAYKKVYDVAQLFRRMTPGSGAYQNEADLFEPEFEESFWGRENYARLLKIKKDIDPENLLTCWQCVGYDRTDRRFGCYPDFKP